MSECINFYDILELVGESNYILLNADNKSALGGPLTEPLTCGSPTSLVEPTEEDANLIETVYSARTIEDEYIYDMHYVEIVTNELPNFVEYSKYYFFVNQTEYDIL